MKRRRRFAAWAGTAAVFVAQVFLPVTAQASYSPAALAARVIKAGKAANENTFWEDAAKVMGDGYHTLLQVLDAADFSKQELQVTISQDLPALLTAYTGFDFSWVKNASVRACLDSWEDHSSTYSQSQTPTTLVQLKGQINDQEILHGSLFFKPDSYGYFQFPELSTDYQQGFFSGMGNVLSVLSQLQPDILPTEELVREILDKAALLMNNKGSWDIDYASGSLGPRSYLSYDNAVTSLSKTYSTEECRAILSELREMLTDRHLYEGLSEWNLPWISSTTSDSIPESGQVPEEDKIGGSQGRSPFGKKASASEPATLSRIAESAVTDALDYLSGHFFSEEAIVKETWFYDSAGSPFAVFLSYYDENNFEIPLLRLHNGEGPTISATFLGSSHGIKPTCGDGINSSYLLLNAGNGSYYVLSNPGAVFLGEEETCRLYATGAYNPLAEFKLTKQADARFSNDTRWKVVLEKIEGSQLIPWNGLNLCLSLLNGKPSISIEDLTGAYLSASFTPKKAWPDPKTTVDAFFSWLSMKYQDSYYGVSHSYNRYEENNLLPLLRNLLRAGCPANFLAANRENLHEMIEDFYYYLR